MRHHGGAGTSPPVIYTSFLAAISSYSEDHVIVFISLLVKFLAAMNSSRSDDVTDLLVCPFAHPSIRLLFALCAL